MGAPAVRVTRHAAPEWPGGNIAGHTRGMTKVMVSLPDDLLEQVDAEARRRSTSRSALLALAARRELGRRDPQVVAAAVARSR